MEQREVAGITIQLTIELVRRAEGEEGVRRLLELAGEKCPLEELENPRAWHSVDTRRRLFRAGIEVTGDPDFPWRVGADVLSYRRQALLRNLFSHLGSPAGILRALPAAHSKFDTACESRLVSQEPGHAMVEFRTKAGYEPSAHECRYAMGLYSQITVLFGLPPASVVQLQCQVEGAECCLIQIDWPPERQPKRARRGLDTVQLQLQELQGAVTELLGSSDLGEVAEHVIAHAGAAVAAQQLLVAVRLGEGEPIVTAADGISQATAQEIGESLLESGVLPPVASSPDTRFLVSDVSAKERSFGKLVAFSAGPFMDGEQQLLDAYSHLAANAIEVSRALRVAEARQHTAEVLASFAAKLISVQEVEEIAWATVQAAKELVSSERAILFRHDEENDSLVPMAQVGYDGALAEAVRALVITEDDTFELRKILTAPDRPRVYDKATADQYLREMMELFGVEIFAAIPIRSARRVLGALAVSWTNGERPHDVDLVAQQLSGIADQAAGAWEKANLLEQIHEQASIDALTGLANRRVFAESLANLLGREEGAPLAVVFCDVDRFKNVNDALGHAAGDELLIAVGQRLRRCVRSDDLVARLGGDEFTVLMADAGDSWRPEAFAAKVKDEMRQPIEIDGSQVLAHLSLGAIEALPGRTSVKDVLRRADAAMYVAKSQGGDRLVCFEEEMLAKRSQRLELESALADAVASGEQFIVVFEPQVDIVSGDIVGAEALVRWKHPTEGLLAPDRFLPVAEETGLITAIDLQVLSQGLEALSRWHKQGLGLHLSVNFSARTLTSPGLVTLVNRELDRTGAPPDRLEVELTESSAIVDPEALSEILLALRGLRVSVAIDDVGTGYSSLALLHKLPAQKLKIDRSFVQKIAEDDASRSVVEAVLLLADRLGQEVVAEGVETSEQVQELKALGCRLAQGYLYARPGTEEQLLAHLEKGL
jgi:diguanylate cyclase (GGDEF)-like protein